MPRGRTRHEEPEEHVNHERWLVTYADMLTLLMVLFIVMFAISQVDQRKFEQLKDGLADGFGETAAPFQGGRSVMNQSTTSPLAPIRPTLDGSTDEKDGAQASTVSRQEAGRTARDAYGEAEAEVRRLERLKNRIRHALAKRHLENDVALAIDERGLRISLVSRHIVFRANIAEMTQRGRLVCDVLAPILGDLPNQIDVDGHTNQVKVQPKYYPTDWELSAARAVNVLRYLAEHGGVPIDRMEAVAFGHTRPLMDPSLPGSQQLNKRVDIVVRSSAREDARKLFAQVLSDRQKM